MRPGVVVAEDEAGLEVHDPRDDPGNHGRGSQGAGNPDATVRYNHAIYVAGPDGGTLVGHKPAYLR